MRIYADILFLINFVSSYIMLDLTSRIIKRRASLTRKAISAAAGALLAVIGFASGDYAGAIKLSTWVIMPLIAFGFRGSDTVRNIAVFSLLSALMAGIFTLISGADAAQTVIIRGGIMYFNLPTMRFIIIFAVSYAIITAAAWFIKRRKNIGRRDIKIRCEGKTVTVKALIDSGNTLKEPITGKDVIIAEWGAVRELFGGEEYADVKRAPDKYRLWLVPYHSLGNTGGLIYAFLADDIYITEEKRSAGKIFVGITTERLSAKNEYNALMGASL